MSRLLLVAAVLLAATGCSKSEAESPAPATNAAARPSKDPDAARKLIGAGAVVVDVRTPDEFAAEHLPQATNIPVQELAQRIAEVDKLTGGDKTKPVVVHCASGNRSTKAKQQLEAAGYTQVVNGGGLDDLQ